MARPPNQFPKRRVHLYVLATTYQRLSFLAFTSNVSLGEYLDRIITFGTAETAPQPAPAPDDSIKFKPRPAAPPASAVGKNPPAATPDPGARRRAGPDGASNGRGA